jgi:vesicle transport through interaction with t-SNAREs protein 1
MSLFDVWISEFNENKQSVEANIQKIKAQSGEPKKLTIKQCNKALDEMDKLVQQMNLESRNLPASQKNKIQSQIRGFKAELQQIKNNLKNNAALITVERQELFGGITEDLEISSYDQRERLLKSSDKLDKTSDRIHEANKLALESETIGKDVLVTLSGQRQQIENSKDSLQETNTYLSNAKKILNGMGRRAMTNKFILIIVILILLGIIGIVLYFQYK